MQKWVRRTQIIMRKVKKSQSRKFFTNKKPKEDEYIESHLNIFNLVKMHPECSWRIIEKIYKKSHNPYKLIIGLKVIR